MNLKGEIRRVRRSMQCMETLTTHSLHPVWKSTWELTKNTTMLGVLDYMAAAGGLGRNNLAQQALTPAMEEIENELRL
jgi:hypothetical protein